MFDFNVCGKWDYSKSHISENDFFKSYQFLKGEEEYTLDYNTISFYLSLLAAGITEDMLFSSPDSQYQRIESSITSYLQLLPPANWCNAVYSGRYGFAADIISKYLDKFNEVRDFEQIVMSENADFIDLITNNGNNENYIRIMLSILVQDYLRGGRSIFEYVKRYCPNKNLSDEKYLDQALLSLNDPDRLYEAICNETRYIIKERDCSVSVDEYNMLAAKLMCRCAELGMKLKKFTSFRYMFIFLRSSPTDGFDEGDPEKFFYNYVNFEENGFIENDEDNITSAIELPEQLADLIDVNTSVCSINYNNFENGFYHYKIISFMPVYFPNNASEASKPFDELEYIGMKFKEKYGYKLKLKTAPDDLENFNKSCADIIELDISHRAMIQICNNKKLLKTILKKNILSNDNIETLIKCCTEAIVKNQNKNAIITLNELNNALNKTNI